MDQRAQRRRGCHGAQRLGRLCRSDGVRRRRRGALQRRTGRDRPRGEARPLPLTSGARPPRIEPERHVMKVALDPYMFRTTPLQELPALVADLGYEYIELSPREDLTPFFLHPRIDDAGVRQFKKALDAAGVKVAAHLPLYRWSGP